MASDDLIRVRVEQAGPAVGTLRWLLEQDLTISLSGRQDLGRAVRDAWLVGPAGARLLPLASTLPGLAGTARLTRHEAERGGVPWTDAAWEVLSKLAAHAEQLLAEPAWMAGAVAVCFEPVSPECVPLLADSCVDPGARKVLYDFLVDQAAKVGPPPPPLSPGDEWEIPF